MISERVWLTQINTQNIIANNDVETETSNVVYVDFGRKTASKSVALAA